MLGKDSRGSLALTTEGGREWGWGEGAGGEVRGALSAALDHQVIPRDVCVLRAPPCWPSG